MNLFGGCFDVAQLKDEKGSLTERTTDPEFWNNTDEAKKVNLRIESINKVVEPFDELTASCKEYKELIEMLEPKDPMLQEIAGYIPAMESKIRKLELNQMLADEQDKLPAIVTVNAGSGGTEAQDWAQIIQRMLMRYAQIKGFSVELADEQAGEEAGIKSCTFICEGDHPYGYFKSERGVHRLVRISPYDSSKRRHTSFCAVDVVPEVDDNIEIEINPADLKTDTYRAGGAGGQHINKTDSAVRITHKPTGIVVACQTQRSQHKNRATAMKMLRSKLYEKEMDKRRAETDAHHATKSEISWGSQIRSYVLHPYRMVKDHRTDFESPQPDKVLNGELEDFVEAFLLMGAEKK